MKHVLLVTIDVESDEDLVRAIDQVMEVPAVANWTADVLSPRVLRELTNLGHVITHHKRARSWTAIAKQNSV